MPVIKPYTKKSVASIVAGGGTWSIPTNDGVERYRIYGTETLAGSIVINADTSLLSPTQGMIYTFEYVAVTTLGVNSFTIFGLSLTDEQALTKGTITAEWNEDTSLWVTEFHPSFDQTTNFILSSQLPNPATIVLAAGSVLGTYLAAAIAGLGLSQNGSGNLDVNVDGSTLEINADTLRVKDDGVDNAKLADMATMTVKANVTGGSANPTDVSIPTFAALSAWGKLGNAGTVAGTNFIGTTDAIDLVFKVNNIISGRLNIADSNTSFGISSLDSLVSGANNVAIGKNTLTANTTGNNNVALGLDALVSNIGGSTNVALGHLSLTSNTTGDYNVGIGQNSGSTITIGDYNTLVGVAADVDNVNSQNRIALGYGAIADTNFQFAIPDNVTSIKWRGVSYTLPATDGTAGQVLTTDGSGNLSWA